MISLSREDFKGDSTALVSARGEVKLESLLNVTLRDILCASLSLDDGLSAIQNLAIGSSGNDELLFDVARAIEEILLRRPGLANAKLTELSVRLAFSEDRILPELLDLLDTRYTNGFRRTETELLPDIEAIPALLDILGQLSQAVLSTFKLNMRPLLPFLCDEILMTLDAIHARGHPPSTDLALGEVHYLTSILIEEGFYVGAELLLNRLMQISSLPEHEALNFEATHDYACVLTELGMYKEARDYLLELEDYARSEDDESKLAAVVLQLAVNNTRDNEIPYEKARALGDRAAGLYGRLIATGKATKDDLGLAHLVVGSSILANGWREGVSEAIDRLRKGLDVYMDEVDLANDRLMHMFKILVGLGFAHGLINNHESTERSLDYLERAKTIISNVENRGRPLLTELAAVENSIGWVCLTTDSDEFWEKGTDAFRHAIKIREDLFSKGSVSEIELLGSRLGFALSQFRNAEHPDETVNRQLREILVQFVPLFPTDSRAFPEVAIATYNIVWLAFRHGEEISPRLIRLLEDIDRMLSDARIQDDSIFIHGASLLLPLVDSSWNTLRKRASRLATHKSGLSAVGPVIAAMALAKMNLDAVGLGRTATMTSPVDETVRAIDRLMAAYWTGQTSLAKTVKAYYENKDYSSLATGLYGAAIDLKNVAAADSDFLESVEFIKATCVSLSDVLLRFALALENQYEAQIDRDKFDEMPESVSSTQYQYILAEDWLGLMKIADAYLQMVEQSEMVQAKPYLNAVFSNISRALRMMDDVAMIERRLLSMLGEVMNLRYYLRP
ncbi:MAG: hypothetical protein EAX81_04900 [Candidatus Thorarchaeota archaeon]|nr:hypothetical protein [Candidatus Thorarchaeota archaeon]